MVQCVNPQGQKFSSERELFSSQTEPFSSQTKPFSSQTKLFSSEMKLSASANEEGNKNGPNRSPMITCTDVRATNSTCWMLTSPDLASLFPGSISSTFSKSNEKNDTHEHTHTHILLHTGEDTCGQEITFHLAWLLLACQVFPGQLPSATMP